MTSNALANEIEQQLNLTLKHFQYAFKNLENKSVLRIEDSPEIYFLNTAGGKVAGGSFAWVNQKHKNGGIHEPAMVAAFLALRKYHKNVTPVFFDIGALYGYFSLVVQSLFSDVSVCAFEMNPDSFAALGKNIDENKHLGEKNIRCINVGLSDRTILDHKAKIEGFRIHEEMAGEDGIDLNIMKLDDFCRDQNIQPTIMKIDVEGYQAKIIPGAMETIANSKPIILLEFDNGNFMMETFGCTNKAVVKPLFDLGYSLFWCGEQRRSSSQFNHLSFDELSTKNEKNSLAVFVHLTSLDSSSIVNKG
jgi:FkbM family methyltransferase